MLMALMQVSASTLAQKVTLSDKNTSLSTVFDQISSQTGFDFAYTGTILNKAKLVTIEVKNEDLSIVLKQIFDGQPLDYTIEDKSVVVSAKDPSLLEKLKSALNLDKIEVTGKVVDETGQPLSGATVIVKGTNNSTITDGKGIFTLKNVDPNALIDITYIGFDKKEISSAENLGVIKLTTASDKLDEVQVIAYGETTDRLNTGDVTTVSAKTIGEQPVSNPLLALEGEVPGLMITQSTGYSGSGVFVQIRGQSSIASGNDPFYVIDGVPYSSELLPNLGTILGNSKPTSGSGASFGNPLSFINPDDIESISVLKDADATSIYGSRAANGAIIITTKKGKAGDTKVDVNLHDGWGEVADMLPVMNTQQYLQMRNGAFQLDGSTPQSTDYDVNGFWNQNSNTNWQKVLIGGTDHYQDYNGTISGGSANTQFLVGTTYHRETAVIPGDFADIKGGIHFSITNSSVNQKFHLTLTGSYLSDNNQLPQTDLTQYAVELPPDAPSLYNKDGSLNWMPNTAGTSTWTNPLAYTLGTYSDQVNNLVGNATLSYTILSGLDIKSSFGYTDMQQNELGIDPLTALPPEQRAYSQNAAQYENNNIHSWIIEPQLNYKLIIGKGKLDALMGSTVNQVNSNGTQYYATGFSSIQLLKDPTAASNIYSFTTNASIYKYAALFGRLNYNWDDKYLIDLNARRDGSSRFGPANEFHNFESAGLGWIFSKESFIQTSLPWLSFGKLRASYGTTGNDQIGNYTYLNQYNPVYTVVPYQGVQGLSPANLNNPYLEWEVTKKAEAGLELGFLKDRILLTTNYYQNRSSNELLSYNLPAITGFTGITENFPATIQNSGWEFTLKTANIKSKDFSWSTNINLSLPQNKLIAFPNLASSSYASSLVIGQPVNVEHEFKFLGVNAQTGEYQFAGANGPTSNPSYTTDLTTLINPNPTLFGGFQNSFRYKGLTLDVLFNFVKQIGLNSEAFGLFPGYFNGIYDYGNQPLTVENAWTKSGDITNVQRYSTGFNYYTPYEDVIRSNAAYSDASYIRLKNLSLSLQLPQDWKDKMHLQNARLFVQGQNLLTFTHYKGMDPETLSSTTLPPLKVLTMGIQVGL